MKQGPEEYFKAGLVLLKRGNDREAAKAFRRAHEMAPSEPRYLSYFGLCLARVERRTKEAVRLCEKAAREDFYRSDIFLNLGRVYLLAGNRKKAYGAFRQGHRVDRTDRELRAELEKMGMRRPPVLGFLRRENPVNRIAGKVRDKLTLRKSGRTR
jgi:Flp pilus assembly protein TadD